MDVLFAVDTEARCKALGIAERHVRRQERTKPLLDNIRSKDRGSAVRCIALQRTQQSLPLRARALVPHLSLTSSRPNPNEYPV